MRETCLRGEGLGGEESEGKMGMNFKTYCWNMNAKAYCWYCNKDINCDCTDSTCWICGRPYDKERCYEYGFDTEGKKLRIGERVEGSSTIDAMPVNR